MTKRGIDAEMEGPSAKSRREADDDGGSGRTGRVRKKSAKVLEMEEFEQVEKTQHVGKKSKTVKSAQKTGGADDTDTVMADPVESPAPKPKAKASKTPPAVPKLSLATSLMQAPITVTPSSSKSSKSSSVMKMQGLSSKPVSQFVPVQSSGILMTSANSEKSSTQMLAEAIKKENQDGSEDSGKGKPSQSVIKYLLNSPSASSKASDSGSELVGGGGKKSSSKKSKAIHEKAVSGSSVKSKSAKVKLELGSDDEAEETTGNRASLKMLISTGSTPQSAHVTMNTSDSNVAAKGKKASKKKIIVSGIKSEAEEVAEKSTKKISKKKQKLIEDAILAAQSPSPPVPFQHGVKLEYKQEEQHRRLPSLSHLLRLLKPHNEKSNESNSERCKKYRNRLKAENPTKAERIRLRNVARNKAYRSRPVSEEELAHRREHARIRAQRFRDARKAMKMESAEPPVAPKPTKPKARKGDEEQRRQWRKYKQEQRKNWSEERLLFHREQSLKYYYNTVKGRKRQKFQVVDSLMESSGHPQVWETALEDNSELKLSKKKKKVKLPEEPSVGEVVKPELELDDAEEETTLVIADPEKKKKKTLKKKKSKDKSPSEPKPEEEKKMSKRAPTAYMLFCNFHRPAIVNENPGIEFAGISKKLGELWQTLSTKQKLQWRRKAQRRMKRSNLISTGKTSKEASSQGSGAGGSSQMISVGTGHQSAQVLAGNAAAAVRYINSINRSPVETPQSPTKLNLSIEPVDVAAHLKLLGESLSIIGMRLQEHKGMIAVQGSLSVLLDSLLCACGPLLCLTQQVPDMDGCDPLVHGQTLDSVAYVMPGL